MSDDSEQRRRAPRGDAYPENVTVDGMVPPHDLAAEAAVLSACMLGGLESVDDVVPLVAPEDFYSEAHRRIFEACVGLAVARQPVDVVQVSSWLRDRNRLAQIGGAPFISQILDAAPAITKQHLQAYANRVRNRARLRRLANKLRLAMARCYAGVPDEETDEFLDGLERDISAICGARHAGGLVHVGTIVREVMTDLRKHEASGGGPVGIPTGFTRLDRRTGGLHGGDLTIVAARPGLGKTAFVMGICENVSENENQAGVVFSLEMPRKQLTTRLICSMGRVVVAKSRIGGFTPSDWQKITLAAHNLFPRNIWIDDAPNQSFPMIRAKLRRKKAELDRQGKRLAIAIVDYLQLMRTRPRKGGESRAEVIGEITRESKALAKELDIPLVLLSQLNREVERRDDKRPVMSDLRDSGEIEQDADNILMLYRDDYYYKDSDEKNLAEVIIGKQRNGPTGFVKVGFDKEWTRFFNLRDNDDNIPPNDDGVPYERPARDEGEHFHTKGM